MNYQILEDYLFALRRKRDLYGHLGDEQNESLYDRYADSIDFPIRHIRYGTSLTVDEIAVYREDLLGLFSPHMMQQLVPAGRVCRPQFDAERYAPMALASVNLSPDSFEPWA